MDIHLTFPGGKRVEAAFGAHHVNTDQSLAHGGDGSAPEPFELFLASLASCAGLYVLIFCQSRNISTDGIELVQHHHFDDAGHLERVELEIRLPPEFPDKYRAAVVRAAEGCKVSRMLAAPPKVVVTATTTARPDDVEDVVSA
jgi:ribosomal protein S12 methylthiotransferase accessory factor